VLDSTEGTATEKVEQLIDKAQWEKFWYEQSGKWSSPILNMFYGAVVSPRLNFENVNQVRNLYASFAGEEINFYINCSKAQDVNRCFQSSENLRFIVGIDTASAVIVQSMFNQCLALETIQEPLNFQNVVSATNMTSVFAKCNALKNIKFVSETIKVSIAIPSPVLSDESIQSIIDGLATVETTQKLTLHTDVVVKLTDDQLLTMASKKWEVG
jgi:hypothetical protein